MKSLWIVVPLVIAYLGTFRWMWESWWFEGSYYAHAPIVVALGLFLAWSGRDRWTRRPAVVDGRGWLLLGPGLLAHATGGALTIDSLSGASLVLSTAGAVWLLGGFGRLWDCLPLIALLALVIPMPLFVSSRLVVELKEFAVHGGLGLAQAFGFDGVRSGAAITVPGEDDVLVVAEACSGLRSLVALVTLGFCLAFFAGSQRGARRWAVFAVAGPVAVLTNLVRIAVLCGVARAFGVGFASGFGHDLVNALVWILDLGILLSVDRIWTRLSRSEARG